MGFTDAHQAPRTRDAQGKVYLILRALVMVLAVTAIGVYARAYQLRDGFKGEDSDFPGSAQIVEDTRRERLRDAINFIGHGWILIWNTIYFAGHLRSSQPFHPAIVLAADTFSWLSLLIISAITQWADDLFVRGVVRVATNADDYEFTGFILSYISGWVAALSFDGNWIFPGAFINFVNLSDCVASIPDL
ncbi:MAG: hypothetical protein M1817_006881 [Caeruleum heppii]|nr:MAG: hypothetical protein M1817_006881 [Caeruleum heppii]